MIRRFCRIAPAAFAWMLSVSALPPQGEDTAGGHAGMAAALRAISERMPSENYYYNEALVRVLKARLEHYPEGTPLTARAKTALQLGRQELYLGREREAIAHMVEARKNLLDYGAAEDALNGLRFYLGVAYLRLGETENCCARNTIDSCVFPIRGAGVHTATEGSWNAIEEFGKVLETVEPDTELHLSAKWLLNIAHMTLGQYPDQVPPEYRIPPERFQTRTDFPRFHNIAPEMGLDTFSNLGGAIFDDFNGDGWLDLVVSSWHPADPLRVYVNRGGREFEDRTGQSGLEGIGGGCNLIQGDYDNDGDLDIFVLRGGWLYENGQHPSSLLRNDGNGVFRDVTFEAGLAYPAYPTQTAAFADYDLDGDLDLYIGNESSDRLPAPSQLFRNNGDGTFTDVADEAGVTHDQMAKGVTWGDFDGDRYPDLYVSNYGFMNRLYWNNGDGTFWDVAIEENVHAPEESFAAWFWDSDNDGVLDLFVSDYSGEVEDVAAYYFGMSSGEKHDRLYRGLAGGGFEDVSRSQRLNRPTFAMGANFGDLNNDGFLDIYLGTGWPDYSELMPNVMFLSREGREFVDVTTEGGFGNLQKGHGVSFADFDNDGDQDVFIEMGGALKGDRYFDVLHENPGFGNDWIAVTLRGTRSNAAAIGSRIRVVVVNTGVERSVYRHVNSGGSFGANPLRQTIGLGRDAEIGRIEVFWPVTGRTQVIENPPKNAFLEIVEDRDGFVVAASR